MTISKQGNNVYITHCQMVHGTGKQSTILLQEILFMQGHLRMDDVFTIKLSLEMEV